MLKVHAYKHHFNDFHLHLQPSLLNTKFNKIAYSANRWHPQTSQWSHLQVATSV